MKNDFNLSLYVSDYVLEMLSSISPPERKVCSTAALTAHE